MTRPGIPGLPSKRFPGAAGNPAMASVRATGNTVSGAGFGTVTLNVADVLDRFSYSSNVITCLQPGVYSMTVSCGAVQTAGTGLMGYRITGGTDVTVLRVANTTELEFMWGAVVKLGANDTIEIRTSGGGNALQVFVTTVSLTQVSTFQ